ncbi:hypothetical protein PHYC_02163 [Phycisphaerales bacterium]|nr:hypothetical protein PHYC_02163 [Phycisphaerales bacterium]
MVRSKPEGVRSVKKGVWSWVLAGVVWAAPASAQPAAPEAPSFPTIDLWGGFPKVDAGAPFLPLDDAWPKRWSRNGHVGVVEEITSPIYRPEGERWGFSVKAKPAASVPEARMLLGESAPDGLQVLLEGPGAFVVGAELRPEGVKVPRRRQFNADLTFRFVSAQEEGPALIRIERTWFAYFAPEGLEGNARPRAVVLLMPGMFGTPEPVASGLTISLRKRGMGVLRMIAHPSRLTERLELTLDPSGDLEGEAKRAAAAFDSREAECAYAAQAAFLHLESSREETVGVPSVVVGFSAGGITLAPVVARDSGRYQAAVMVGAGCHWWLMNEKSNYRTFIDAIEVTWSAPAAEADRARVRETYLQAARLDSYNTAQAMRGRATLMIQGAADMAVPTPLGDVLWERCGRPERWMVDGGHELLFMQLSSYYERIGEWIEGRLAPGNADKAVGP